MDWWQSPWRPPCTPMRSRPPFAAEVEPRSGGASSRSPPCLSDQAYSAFEPEFPDTLARAVIAYLYAHARAKEQVAGRRPKVGPARSLYPPVVQRLESGPRRDNCGHCRVMKIPNIPSVKCAALWAQPRGCPGPSGGRLRKVGSQESPQALARGAPLTRHGGARAVSEAVFGPGKDCYGAAPTTPIFKVTSDDS